MLDIEDLLKCMIIFLIFGMIVGVLLAAFKEYHGEGTFRLLSVVLIFFMTMLTLITLGLGIWGFLIIAVSEIIIGVIFYIFAKKCFERDD